MPTTTIVLPVHIHAEDIDKPEDQQRDCEVDDFEVKLEYEPGESNYGADADGNRGIYVPGYMSAISETPATCPECGHTFTDEEKKEIDKRMSTAADEYSEEPDYDDDRWYDIWND